MGTILAYTLSDHIVLVSVYRGGVAQVFNPIICIQLGILEVDGASGISLSGRIRKFNDQKKVCDVQVLDAYIG